MLHAYSQLKFHPDVSESAEHVKGGVFHLLGHFPDAFCNWIT